MNKQESAIDQKRRQPFQVESATGDLLAFGLLYDEGNCQVLWRNSIGYTAEQYHSITGMFGIEIGATVVRIIDKLPDSKTVNKRMIT